MGNGQMPIERRPGAALGSAAIGLADDPGLVAQLCDVDPGAFGEPVLGGDDQARCALQQQVDVEVTEVVVQTETDGDHRYPGAAGAQAARLSLGPALADSHLKQFDA
jgi:hypothetical protein